MKLSTRILLPVAFALTAGAAFAEGPLQGNEVFNFSSNLSRAEVRAETIAARDAGLLTVGEITQVNDNFVGAKTRAQVRAELAEARRLGLVDYADNQYPKTISPMQAEQIRMAGLAAGKNDQMVMLQK